MTINYNTGAGNETAKTLEEAMIIADNGAAYTQTNIEITDENDNIVASRQWWGCMEGVEDMENPIKFGDFGFYGDWEIL